MTPGGVRMATRLVHPPRIAGEPAGSTSTPIYQTATFAVAESSAWDYTRSGNPTRDVLEGQLRDLDGAVRSLAYSSGMAAVAAVLRLSPPGSTVVAGDDLYGGTMRFLAALAAERDIEVRFVDVTDLGQVAGATGPRTSLVWVETPSNPRLRRTDVAGVARLAHAVGARVAVDNSVLSPLQARPLAEGADFAVQSATKILGGHGDLTAGVVSVAKPELAERLACAQNAEGSALAPFESWLLLRGLETLAVRLERQSGSAARVVQALSGHPEVDRVYSAPGSCLISFIPRLAARAERLLSATRLFRTTVSFGGVTSSISRPAAMSHASVPEAWRSVQRLPQELVRLSIGLEDGADLIADLEAALAVPVAV